MHNFAVAIINGSYIHHLKSRQNQAVNVRAIKGNRMSVAYIRLKLIGGRHLSLTCKGTRMLHIKRRSQYKKYCTKLNNKVI